MCICRFAALLVVTLHFFEAMAIAEDSAGQSPVFVQSKVLTDEFDGEFDLSWDIIREEAEFYSLETHPGELALTTRPGSMYARNELAYRVRPPNIFLLNEAIGAEQDFEATVFVSLYEPAVQYQQIGLLMYQDDANYAKWEISLRETGTAKTRLAAGVEVDNKMQQIKSIAYPVDGPFWLRMTRVGDQYTFAVSDDGDSFVAKHTATAKPDAKLSAPRIGFVAKNGNVERDGNVIVLESFELRLGAE